MAKPKHRRCATCGVVTSRYARTERQGPFTFSVWVRDADSGEQQDRGTGRFYCNAHAVQGPPPPFVFTPVPALPPVTVDDLLNRAARDESLDTDTFAVVSRALRGVDPIAGEVPA